jgi:hypothetical protein
MSRDSDRDFIPNNEGDYSVTLDAEMKAFDRLPAPLRRALADSVENFSAHALFKRFLRRGHSPEFALATLDRWNREERASWRKK